MLLSSTAEGMYWTGRYFERAQALARAVAGYERLSLDGPEGEAFDLSPLLALVGRATAPAKTRTKSELLAALVLDERNPSSVRGALEAARENLRSGRTVMPAGVWAPVNQLHARVSELEPGDTAAVLATLDEVEATGSQIEGRLAAGMSRDAAYAFWCIGCRIERADMLLQSLRVLVPRLLHAGDRRFADVRASGLLECVGAYSMFRRRHQTHVELRTMLDFLLLDPEFPRSLRSLLVTIEHELDTLPRPGPARAALARCFPLALSEQPSPGALLPLPDRGVVQLAELSEVVAETYFPASHRPESVQSPAKLASLPPATDPFESLGREHASVEAVLRLLDELTARAACGQLVDRSAVRSILDFFTDFGVMSHHEKEEAILMPVLLAAGFDWQEGPLASMRRDHRQEHYFLRVLTHLCGQRNAWSSEDSRHFVNVGMEFTQFLRAHMRLESRDVFEPAAARLSCQVKASLMEELSHFDAQSAGSMRTALDRLEGLLETYGIVPHAAAEAPDLSTPLAVAASA